MLDIFISYARKDRSLAQLFAAKLERAGLSVWWDAQLIAGQPFDVAIEQAIGSARCVVVLWTPHSTQSNYVRAEAAFAQEAGKLLPIVIDETEQPLRFRTLQAAALRSNDLSDQSLTSVASEVLAFLRKPPLGAVVTLTGLDEATNLHAVSFIGMWSAQMPGSRGAESLSLEVSAGLAGTITATMQVSYSLNDSIFLMLESFNTKLLDNRLRLEGVAVEHVSGPGTPEYHLDTFELDASNDRQHLHGWVEHSRGRFPIEFCKEKLA